jgi:hypothetical protein
LTTTGSSRTAGESSSDSLRGAGFPFDSRAVDCFHLLAGNQIKQKVQEPTVFQRKWQCTVDTSSSLTSVVSASTVLTGGPFQPGCR